MIFISAAWHVRDDSHIVHISTVPLYVGEPRALSVSTCHIPIYSWTPVQIYIILGLHVQWQATLFLHLSLDDVNCVSTREVSDTSENPARARPVSCLKSWAPPCIYARMLFSSEQYGMCCGSLQLMRGTW